MNVFATYNLLLNDASPAKKSRLFAEISLFTFNVFTTFNNPLIFTSLLIFNPPYV